MYQQNKHQIKILLQRLTLTIFESHVSRQCEKRVVYIGLYEFSLHFCKQRDQINNVYIGKFRVLYVYI